MAQGYMSSVMEDALEGLGFETPGSRLRKLEEKLAALEKLKGSPGTLRQSAAEKLERGQPVTRGEAAAYLGVSTKKIQRMESTGTLSRCPGLGTVVRYAARDVLGLASASSRKGA